MPKRKESDFGSLRQFKKLVAMAKNDRIEERPPEIERQNKGSNESTGRAVSLANSGLETHRRKQGEPMWFTLTLLRIRIFLGVANLIQDLRHFGKSLRIQIGPRRPAVPAHQ